MGWCPAHHSQQNSVPQAGGGCSRPLVRPELEPRAPPGPPPPAATAPGEGRAWGCGSGGPAWHGQARGRLFPLLSQCALLCPFLMGSCEPVSTATISTDRHSLISHTHSPQGLPDAVSAVLMGGGGDGPSLLPLKSLPPPLCRSRDAKLGSGGCLLVLLFFPVNRGQPALAEVFRRRAVLARFHQCPRLGYTSKMLCWKGGESSYGERGAPSWYFDG